MAQFNFVEETPSRRVKRHATSADDALDLLDVANRELPHHAGRSRRSAAFWLQATIQMCNRHVHLCKTIQVSVYTVFLPNEVLLVEKI